MNSEGFIVVSKEFQFQGANKKEGTFVLIVFHFL